MDVQLLGTSEAGTSPLPPSPQQFSSWMDGSVPHCHGFLYYTLPHLALDVSVLGSQYTSYSERQGEKNSSDLWLQAQTLA